MGALSDSAFGGNRLLEASRSSRKVTATSPTAAAISPTRSPAPDTDPDAAMQNTPPANVARRNSGKDGWRLRSASVSSRSGIFAQASQAKASMNGTIAQNEPRHQLIAAKSPPTTGPLK